MGFLKRIMLFLLILLILLSVIAYFMLKDSNQTITYTQEDFINYHMLTDKDIANAPRITNDFYFEASPGDGYSPTNSITFKNVDGINLLEVYLLSLGLKKETRKMGDNDVWSKSDDSGRKLFYVSFDKVNKNVTLTKSIGQ